MAFNTRSDGGKQLASMFEPVKRKRIQKLHTCCCNEITVKTRAPKRKLLTDHCNAQRDTEVKREKMPKFRTSCYNKIRGNSVRKQTRASKRKLLSDHCNTQTNTEVKREKMPKFRTSCYNKIRGNSVRKQTRASKRKLLSDHCNTQTNTEVKNPNCEMPEQMKCCLELVNELLSENHKEYAWPFYEPMDVDSLKLSDYFDVIKKPMDLATVKKKIESGEYKNAAEFAVDMRLLFTNCYRYNPPNHKVISMAKKMQNIFEIHFAKFSHVPTPLLNEVQDISKGSTSGGASRYRISRETAAFERCRKSLTSASDIIGQLLQGCRRRRKIIKKHPVCTSDSWQTTSSSASFQGTSQPMTLVQRVNKNKAHNEEEKSALKRKWKKTGKTSVVPQQVTSESVKPVSYMKSCQMNLDMEKVSDENKACNVPPVLLEPTPVCIQPDVLQLPVSISLFALPHMLTNPQEGHEQGDHHCTVLRVPESPHYDICTQTGLRAVTAKTFSCSEGAKMEQKLPSASTVPLAEKLLESNPQNSNVGEATVGVQANSSTVTSSLSSNMQKAATPVQDSSLQFETQVVEKDAQRIEALQLSKEKDEKSERNGPSTSSTVSRAQEIERQRTLEREKRIREVRASSIDLYYQRDVMEQFEEHIKNSSVTFIPSQETQFNYIKGSYT